MAKNALYELPQADEKAVEILNGLTDDELDAAVTELLEDQLWHSVRPIHDRLQHLFETKHTAALTASAEAAIGFVAFINLVQNTPDGSEISDVVRDEFQTLLGNKLVLEYLDGWYGITKAGGDIRLDPLELHRIGTTSFIVRCRAADQTDLAIKCIVPRYLAIRTIALATRNYQAEMATLRPLDVQTPRVYDYESEQFIAMDFIEGKTLDEDSCARRGGLGAPDLFTKTVEELCDGLRSLARHGRGHLDLSPHNVIVEKKTRSLYLVDFGRNFLVDELLRGGAAYDRIAVYIAPELLRDPSKASYLCDCYSLGMVILDAASGGGLTRTNVAQRLMKLWHEAPGIAHIVERLSAEDPNRRLAFLEQPVTTPAEAYEAIRDQLSREIEIARVIAKGATGEGGLRPLPLWQYLLAGVSHVRALFGTADELRESAREAVVELNGSDREGERAKADGAEFATLGLWSALYLLVWICVFWPAVYLTVGDINAHFPSWLAALFARDPQPPKHPVLLHNLPGRLVATSTALLAISYYINIFSTLDLRHFSQIRSRYGRLAWFTTRILPLVALGAQGYTVLIDPRAWGYTAGIGGLLVSVNNLEWKLLVDRAQREATEDRIGTEFHAFVDGFDIWWRLMGLYSVGVLIVGLLVRYGVAHDELIFAIIIAGGINFLKLYLGNATRQAPWARTHIARTVTILRDAARPAIDASGVAWRIVMPQRRGDASRDAIRALPSVPDSRTV